MRRQSRRIARAVFGAALAFTLAGAANAVQPPDAWVTTKVKMSLLTSEGVSARNVHVDTIEGRVTLHGSVPTEAEKARAQEVASKIDGAREVRNLLQIVPPRQEAKLERSDSQLKKDVRAALKADPALADSSIQVKSVNAGVVLLSGKARTLSDSYRAIAATAAIPGVRRVASEIESPDTLADAELWRDGTFDAATYEKSAAGDMWITTAAKMRLIASGETPGFDINVDTRNGIVTLFGVVASSNAKQANATSSACSPPSAADLYRRSDPCWREVRRASRFACPGTQNTIRARENRWPVQPPTPNASLAGRLASGVIL
jgi:hyperosmotically inducible protein